MVDKYMGCTGSVLGSYKRLTYRFESPAETVWKQISPPGVNGGRTKINWTMTTQRHLCGYKWMDQHGTLCLNMLSAANSISLHNPGTVR